MATALVPGVNVVDELGGGGGGGGRVSPEHGLATHVIDFAWLVCVPSAKKTVAVVVVVIVVVSMRANPLPMLTTPAVSNGSIDGNRLNSPPPPPPLTRMTEEEIK